MSNARRAKRRVMGLGSGVAGETHVIGLRDRATGMVRAEVFPNREKPTLQKFVTDHTDEETVIYTDEAKAYTGLPRPHGTLEP